MRKAQAARTRAEIVGEHCVRGRPVERLTHKRPDGRSVPNAKDIDFFKRQTKIVLRNCGMIDPTQIEDYIARDGYQALAKVLDREERRRGDRHAQGLRAAGPRRRRLSHLAEVEDHPRAARRGEVRGLQCRRRRSRRVHGSQRAGRRSAQRHRRDDDRRRHDRRHERLRLRPRGISLGRRAAGDRAGAGRECGLLGENILGSGFGFKLEIRKGSGAFVCGEETALMVSIEGCRGEPRPRPPSPPQKGLWGKPTLLNNVETYANVPAIILNGGPWYAAFGTEQEQGHEGLRSGRGDQEFRPGGGAGGHAAGRPDLRHRRRHPRGKEFKAAQIGGPSGGCIPKQHLNMPLDYESLSELGRDHGLRRPDRDGRG